MIVAIGLRGDPTRHLSVWAGDLVDAEVEQPRAVTDGDLAIAVAIAVAQS